MELLDSGHIVDVLETALHLINLVFTIFSQHYFKTVYHRKADSCGLHLYHHDLHPSG